MNVELKLMDSEKPGVVVPLEVAHLSLGQRLMRAGLRVAVLGVGGAFVTILPLLHLCGLGTVLVVMPIFTIFAFLVTVQTVGEQQASCPKCQAMLTVPAKTNGWPLSLHCEACGATVKGRPAAT